MEFPSAICAMRAWYLVDTFPTKSLTLLLSQVGDEESDFTTAVRAMRAWCMVESVRWLDIHLSREPHGSVVREDAALIMSGVWGHVLAPMRVCSSDAQVGCGVCVIKDFVYEDASLL